MNKKSLILLAIPALMLSGCTKEISKEEAKEVASKIAAKQKELEAPDYFKVTASMKDASKVEGDEDSDYNSSLAIDVMVEYQISKKTVHYSMKEVKNGKEDTLEGWITVKGDYAYSLYDGSEKVGYKKAIGDKEVEMKDLLAYIEEDDMVMAVESAGVALEGIEEGKEVNEASVKVKDEDHVKYETKYTTSGDGNLTVEGKTTVTGAEISILTIKGTGDGSAEIKLGWDNYRATEFTMKSDVKVSVEILKKAANVELTSESSYKFAYDGEVGVPNVEDYKILN